MKKCAVDGCPRPNLHAKGLCKTHYNRRLKGLPDAGVPLKQKKPCTFPDCGRRAVARGLCSSHEWQRRNGRELAPIRVRIENRPCSVEGCDKPTSSHGHCRTHARHRRQGKELRPIPPSFDPSDEAGFWARVDKGVGCWEWTRSLTTAGYGNLRLPDGRYGYAHRMSWELSRGPIPDGLTIDHLCRNRKCVNPEHLEPVTQAENNRRARAARSGT